MPISRFEINPMKDSGDYIESKQYKMVLNACKNDLQKIFIILLWNTGRRVTEIVGGKLKRKRKDGTIYYLFCEGLKPKDIDWDNEKIHFWILKRKEIRQEPIDVDSKLLNSLNWYIQIYEIDSEKRIVPRTRRWGNNILRKISERTGIKTFSGRSLHPHCFRHSWNVKASRVAKHPEDIVLQKEIMKHSNINITMSYLKFAHGRQKELIKKMAE